MHIGVLVKARKRAGPPCRLPITSHPILYHIPFHSIPFHSISFCFIDRDGLLVFKLIKILIKLYLDKEISVVLTGLPVRSETTL